MTGPLPGGSLGDAYINVHARTDDIEPDLRKGLGTAGKDVEKDADKIGTDVGDHIGKGVEKEVARHGPSIGKELGRAVEKEVVDVAPNFRYNVRGRNGRFITQTVDNIQNEVESAFTRAVSRGGAFDNIRQAFADAIGAAFNVSGNSKLIGFLVPVIAAISALIIGAIQLANSLIAVLSTAPAALVAIGLQVGILMLAFKGVGAAITGAFAAKNAKELQAAIKDLTPAAQAFVRGLLPAKQLFEDIRKLSQEAFFKALGSVLNQIILQVGPIIRLGAGPLASALGNAAKDIATVFLSPAFKLFISSVIPATIKWLSDFGPGFSQFLLGLISFANATLPFLNKLGDLLNSILVDLGGKLFDLGSSAGFTGWLSDMFDTLKLVAPLVNAFMTDLAIIFEQVNKGSGDKAIKGLTDALVVLGTFLASPAGLRAIETLTTAGIIAIQALTGVVIVIGAVLAGVSLLIDYIHMGLLGFIDFAVWLGLTLENIVKAIGHFIADITTDVVQAVVAFNRMITEWFVNLWRSVNDGKGRLLLQVAELPAQIRNALGNLGTLLLNAGKNLIQGLINGIENAVPGLKATLSWVTNLISQHKGPIEKDRKLLEPSGRAVMEGFGVGIKTGAQDIKDILDEFTNGLGGIGVNQTSTHILFGANALQLNFRGALPTSEEAMNTGVAVGAGINSQLAARNTRLAVRTL